jgi:predicted HTH domain antitoxin
MTTTPYPMRIPDEVLALSRLRAQEERLDQATALRQFLHVGAEEYVLKLVADGRISIGRAAELLKTTVYDIQRLAQRHGIEIGATPEQARKSRAIAKRLV